MSESVTPPFLPGTFTQGDDKPKFELPESNLIITDSQIDRSPLTDQEQMEIRADMMSVFITGKTSTDTVSRVANVSRRWGNRIWPEENKDNLSINQIVETGLKGKFDQIPTMRDITGKYATLMNKERVQAEFVDSTNKKDPYRDIQSERDFNLQLEMADRYFDGLRIDNSGKFFVDNRSRQEHFKEYLSTDDNSPHGIKIALEAMGHSTAMVDTLINDVKLERKRWQTTNTRGDIQTFVTRELNDPTLPGRSELEDIMNDPSINLRGALENSFKKF